jgi:membrane protease subunit HflC
MELILSKRKALAAVFGLALLLRLTVFGVDETEFVMITTFGRHARTIATPGLSFKAPWQTRRSFDRRLQVYRIGRLPFYTRDKKALDLDLYVVWQIDQPLRFLQAVSDAGGAEDRLHNIVLAAVSRAMGRLDFAHLINTDPSLLAVARARLREVSAQCDDISRRQYGLAVVDLRIQRLAFPEENKPAVFARMRAERERIARQYRAEGQEQALKIRAQADREKERILSEAYREAERVRGDGDARSTRIYGAAHGADPELYELTRTLEAYKKMLDKQTTAILAADSELLRLLTHGQSQTTKR